MNRLREAYHRVRYASYLERDLQEKLEGLEWHIPGIEWEQDKQLQQRGDYRELRDRFYGNPEETEPPVDYVDISYRISNVKVNEIGMEIYKLKRIFDLQDFQGYVHLKLDFGNERLPVLTLDSHPWFDDLFLTYQYKNRRTELKLSHEYQDKEYLESVITVFNQILAQMWVMPNTIPELKEENAKIRAYNQFKERFR